MNLIPSFAIRTARLRFEMKMKYSRASNVFLDHEPSCVKLKRSFCQTIIHACFQDLDIELMKNKIKFELRMNLSPCFAIRTASLRFEMKMKYSRASNVFLDHEPSCVKLLDISEKSIFPSLVM